MTVLLKEALMPNLVQTLENNPAFIHGGPFANIAHGCNSVLATRTALKLADYVVTEAGFGADLGAEKFIDIKCRKSGLRPAAVVIVATIRALKYHGGCDLSHINEENLAALEKGLANLARHTANIKDHYGLPCVVSVNHFAADTHSEHELLAQKVRGLGVPLVPARGLGAAEASDQSLAELGGALGARFIFSGALAARALGLPGMSPDTVRGFRDKELMKERVRAAGLRVPRFVAASSPAMITCMPRPSAPTLPTTTRSPSESPSSTSAMPARSSTTPSCTDAISIVLPSIRYTYGLPSSADCRMAAAGTTSALGTTRLTTRPLANVPPLSVPSALGIWTYTATLRVAGSTVGLTRASFPSKERPSAVKWTV